MIHNSQFGAQSHLFLRILLTGPPILFWLNISLVKFQPGTNIKFLLESLTKNIIFIVSFISLFGSVLTPHINYNLQTSFMYWCVTLNPLFALIQVFSLRYLPTLVIKLWTHLSKSSKHRLWQRRFHQWHWLSQLVWGLPTTFMVVCSLWIGQDGVGFNKFNMLQ